MQCVCSQSGPARAQVQADAVLDSPSHGFVMEVVPIWVREIGFVQN